VRRHPAPDLAAALTESRYAEEAVAVTPTFTHTDSDGSCGGGCSPATTTQQACGSHRFSRDARLDVPSTLLALATSTHPRGEMHVTATGEIDMISAPLLLSGLESALRHPSCRTLITDLRGVQFMGASGISVLLAIQASVDTHDVRLALVADHPAVLRPLQITGTTDLLTIFPTIAAARATV
jgi:anti-anti-sigma factor